jgi:hypothetical protein
LLRLLLLLARCGFLQVRLLLRALLCCCIALLLLLLCLLLCYPRRAALLRAALRPTVRAIAYGD